MKITFNRARSAFIRAANRLPIRRRARSASPVDLIIADITRRLIDMSVSADVQPILDQLTALPAAITAQVNSEVSTAEAAKDAQRATDIAAISAAVTAVSTSVTPPPAS